jgi:signal transduction histidine kinase
MIRTAAWSKSARIDVSLRNTRKRSPLRGWWSFMPGAISARGCSDAEVGPAPIRAHLLSLLVRPTSPSLALGLVVAASLIVAETLLGYLLGRVAPESALGVVYLLGVVVIAIGWGFWLAAATSVASTLAFDYFLIKPIWSLTVTDPRDWVALAVFLVVALLASTVADLARRAAEADQRRREAELAADLGRVLAEQQAALRRVATLVARGVSSSEVFSAVVRELARCLGVYYSALFRYEPDGAAILVAARDDDPGLKKIPVGERFSLEGENVPAMVLRTGRAARMDSYKNAPGSVAARFRDLGLRAAVGAPIVVYGRLWGAAIVGWSRPEPLPPDTEARVGDFADLVATAIANAEAHAQLTASRARIVAAADDARRRLERDLHDGAQQRLVSLGLELRTAEAAVPFELDELREQISDIVAGLAAVSQELQEISRGIHPAILSKGGLGPALKALGRRSAVPVKLDVGVDRRLPEPAEVAAYYVVAEALTNVAKHARASEVSLCVDIEGADLRLAIRDDGVGGADSRKGSGLIGLIDRVEALGGQMQISSHAGHGTSLLVTMPLEVK